VFRRHRLANFHPVERAQVAALALSLFQPCHHRAQNVLMPGGVPIAADYPDDVLVLVAVTDVFAEGSGVFGVKGMWATSDAFVHPVAPRRSDRNHHAEGVGPLHDVIDMLEELLVRTDRVLIDQRRLAVSIPLNLVRHLTNQDRYDYGETLV